MLKVKLGSRNNKLLKEEQQTITVPINEIISWDEEISEATNDPYEQFQKLKYIPMDQNEFKEKDRLDKTCFFCSLY